MRTYKLFLIFAIAFSYINSQEATEVDEGQMQENIHNKDDAGISDEEHEEILKNLGTGDLNLDDIDDEKVNK